MASRLEVAVVMVWRVFEVFSEEVGLLPVVPLLLFLTARALQTPLALHYSPNPCPKIISPDGCTPLFISATSSELLITGL